MRYPGCMRTAPSTRPSVALRSELLNLILGKVTENADAISSRLMEIALGEDAKQALSAIEIILKHCLPAAGPAGGSIEQSEEFKAWLAAKHQAFLDSQTPVSALPPPQPILLDLPRKPKH